MYTAPHAAAGEALPRGAPNFAPCAPARLSGHASVLRKPAVKRAPGGQSLSTLPPALPPPAGVGAAACEPASPLRACLDPCVLTPRSEERSRGLLVSSGSRGSLEAAAGEWEAAAAATPTGISALSDGGLQAVVRQLDACLPLAGECRLQLGRWVLGRQAEVQQVGAGTRSYHGRRIPYHSLTSGDATVQMHPNPANAPLQPLPRSCPTPAPCTQQTLRRSQGKGWLVMVYPTPPTNLSPLPCPPLLPRRHPAAEARRRLPGRAAAPACTSP